jgi:predicted amidohydrolase
MARELCLSAVCFPYLPDEPHTVDAHLAHAKALVGRAASQGAQLVLLPEAFSLVGDPAADTGCQGDVTGKTTELMQQLAAHHRLYLVSSTYEREGRKKHVAVSIIGPDGAVAGRYRKTHLGPLEGRMGLSPGAELPVFDLEFGKVAIIVCMEIHYPEIPRAYALQGAELLLWPTSGYGFNTELLEVLFRSRCIDNQMFGATANYGCLPFVPGRPSGQTYLVGLDGRFLADTGHRPGLATATIDLDATYPMWYQEPLLRTLPTLRETVLRTRRPELYGVLTEPSPHRWAPGIDPEP